LFPVSFAEGDISLFYRVSDKGNRKEQHRGIQEGRVDVDGQIAHEFTHGNGEDGQHDMTGYQDGSGCKGMFASPLGYAEHLEVVHHVFI